jgi:NAD(P)-dependent dehydrogenase (short-subunit alcohol dehydrogenase family)
MGRLQDKVTIVTGATSGMGWVTAERFVAEGAKVVVTGRSKERGEALVNKLGEQARFIAMDMGSESDVKATIEFAVSEFGRLDCLFNNAGSVTHPSALDKVTPDEFEYEMRVLLGGVLFGIQHAAKVMREQGDGGSIINNASTAGQFTGHGPLLYSVAKAGVIHLTKVAAIQLADCNVRVNSISPGAVATPVFSFGTGLDHVQAEAAMPIIESELAKTTPLKRAGKSLDVANLAVFLASDEANYITAQDIAIDGGLIAGLSMDDMQAKFGGLYRTLTKFKA